jgi:hypothetical protein
MCFETYRWPERSVASRLMVFDGAMLVVRGMDAERRSVEIVAEGVGEEAGHPHAGPPRPRTAQF